MKRILVAAVPFLAAAMVVAGPVSATTAKKVSCHQIHDELAAGKTPAEVEKDLKVTKKDIDHCSAKVASSKKHVHGSVQGSTSKAPPAQ
jgi:hypothetical protein